MNFFSQEADNGSRVFASGVGGVGTAVSADPRPGVPGGRVRPGLEALEPRWLLSTIRWINPNGGSWNVPGNWDLNRLPMAGDDVVIDLAGSGAVTLSTGTVEIQSLHSTRPFQFSNDSLWVHGLLEVDNTFQLGGGTLRGATIAAGTTAQVIGGFTYLQDVTLNGNLLIPQGQVGMEGTWSNHGTITVSGGTIDFYGTFPTAAIGHLVHTSGEVNIDGVLENTGSTLTLDNTAGSWQTVNGGTIHGGTVVAIGSNRLMMHYRGALDGVVYDGTLDVSNGSLTVTNGLILNGTLLVGASGTGASVTFDGTQTLGGTGIVVFGTSYSPFVFGSNNGTVTLAPTITVRGGMGALVNVINQGTIDVSAATTSMNLYGTWRNEGVITLGQGTVTLDGTFSTSGLGSFRRSGGTVNLTGTLDNTNQTLTLNAATGSWQLAGGTILGGTVAATGGAALVPTNRGGTLNGVNLSADVQIPANTALNFAGAWSNHGTLTLSGGTLNLGGTFTPATLGTWRRSGGTVNITGTLNNAGNTLLLNADTGSWGLNGGTINGGVVVMTDGTQLVAGSYPSRLIGVTVNGYLNVTGSTLTIDGGLTLNGFLAVGSGATGASVVFEGTQTLAGAATVLLGKSTFNSLSDSGGVVTFGATILVRGGSGRLSDFVNQGTIEVSTPDADLTLGADGNSWRNGGALTLTAGALTLGSSNNTFTVADLGTFTRSGGTVNLAGTLDNTGQTLTLNAATGSWLLAGGRITGGSLTTAAGAALVPTSRKGTLNGVALFTDINVGLNAGLTLAGNWVNYRTLSVTGGTLDLGGTMTIATLGVLQRSSGTVNLSGTLDNTGTTLTLDATTGSWALAGGTITGGTIVTQGNASLMANSSSSQLDGVTLDGALDVEGGFVNVSHGLELNGTITLGRLSAGGRLAFAGGDQALDGTGTITFGTSSNNLLEAISGTVQLGRGITIRGGTGQINNFINEGTIAVSAATSNITLGGGWRNDGAILLEAGLLNLGGTFTLAGLGNLQRSGGTVSITGMLNNSNELRLDATTGSWQLDGGTIRGGTVTTADGAALLLTNHGGTFDGVTLNTDLQITNNATLYLNGSWHNQGTLTLTSGTLNLGGQFTRDDLGDFRRDGGTVNLTGTLRNAGHILTLDAATGPWYLKGGTIDGGTILLNDGIVLDVSAPFLSQLNGVTVDGYLAVSNGPLMVTNGLTVNGILALGNGSGAGQLSFNGTQTFAGAALVRLSDSLFNSFGASNGTVTLGPNVEIQGGMGRLVDVVNQGIIDVSESGAHVILQGDNWHNFGTIRVSNGSLDLGGTFTQAVLGTLQHSGGTINITGTLDNTLGELALNDTTGAWQLAGGTITGGRITTSGRGSLITTQQGGILNGVTLDTDIDVAPNALLTLAGAWVNHRMLSVTGGTLNLGGTFTPATLGRLRHSDGTVNLTGTLDNTGTQLTLDDTTGSWVLSGTIQGGTVTPTGGGHLFISSYGGHLNGVTLNSDVQVVGANLTITNGLTLNGTLTLGNLITTGSLTFNGTQMLGGTGTIVFADSGFLNAVQATTGTVTIGPGITVRGASGSISNFINQGTIELSALGGTLSLSGSNWRNDGVLTLSQGTLNLGGTFTAAALGDFRRSGGTVTLSGTLDNTGRTLTFNDTIGS